MFNFACDNLKIDQKKEYNNVLNDDEEVDENEIIIKENKPAQYIQFSNRCIEKNDVIKSTKTINSFEDLKKLSDLNKMNKTKKINNISYLPSMEKGESEVEYRTRVIKLLF
jgi:hypothetical protein